MSKSAIISLAGKQFRVQVGDTFTVNRLSQAAEAQIQVKDVLLVSDGETIKIGTPLVEKASVTLQVVDHPQGEKIRIATYKAKARQRKVKGHRSALTTVKVLKITA